MSSSSASASSSSSSVNNTIALSFGWMGPVESTQGVKRNVGIVDLLFKDAKTKISASLNTHLDSIKTTGELNKLSYTCYRTDGGLKKTTNPDILSVTVEQVQNLRLQAGFFQESTNPYNVRTYDSSGNQVIQKVLTRIDSDVPLTLPEKLEVGKKYRLVVTSNNLVLTAQLVEEETVAPKAPTPAPASAPKAASASASISVSEDAQLALDRKDLLLFLSANLLTLMGMKMQEFTMEATPYVMRNQLHLKTNFGGELPGVIALKDAISKFEKTTIKELAAKLRSSQTPSSRNPLFLTCLVTLGSSQGLKKLMRSQLELLIEDRQIHPEVEVIIERISKRFSEICMKQMN